MCTILQKLSIFVYRISYNMAQIHFNFFVAGSKELQHERDTFRVVASELQTYYKKFRRVTCELDIVTFENFSNIANKGRKQAEYNHHIKEIADVVFFVFDGSVGGITMEEFDVAKDSYKCTKRPKIGVFTKVGMSANTQIDELKNGVNEIGQYWVDYKDNEDLRKKIKEEISKLIDTEINKIRDRILKKIIYTIICILAIIVCGYLLINELKLKPKSDQDDPLYSIEYNDNLSTQGYITITPSPTDEVKYCFTASEQAINWENAPAFHEKCDTLYPKTNGFLHLYAKSENGQEWTYSTEFNYAQFIETAVLNRDSATLGKVFDEVLPLVVHLPGNVIDTLRSKPVAALYDYLNDYQYHIDSIESLATDNDIESNQYGRIVCIKLTK